MNHIESRSRGMILALCLALMKSHLECWVQFWSSQYRRDVDRLYKVQWRPPRWAKEWSISSMRKGTNTLNYNAEFLLSPMRTCSVMLADDIWAWCLTKSWHSAESCERYLDCTGNYFWDSLSMHDCCSERYNTGCNLDFMAVYESTPKQIQKVYPTRYGSETCT